MSQWTHVAGIVRVDALKGVLMPGDPALDIKAALLEGVPSGSEGPLQIRTESTREYNSLSWGNATISGDLRDRGPEIVEVVKKWLVEAIRKIKAEKSMIRQLVVQVRVEGHGSTIFRDSWQSESEVGLEVEFHPEAEFQPEGPAST